MKLSIKKDLLESVINTCNAYLENKDKSSSFSCFYFALVGGCLELKASNNEMSIYCKIKNLLSAEEEGKATVHGKSLYDAVRTLDNKKEVLLYTQGQTLFLTQGRSKFELDLFIDEDFTPFPSFANKKPIKIDSNILISGLKKILPSVDTKNSRVAFHGGLVHVKKDRLHFVSSDSKRLSVYALEQENEDELQIIIPHKAITEMQKIAYEKMNVFYENKNFILINENLEFFTKAIADEFVAYEQYLPKKFKHTLTLDRDSFLAALEKLQIAAERGKIEFFKDRVVFTSSGTNIKAKTEIESKAAESLPDDFKIIIYVAHLIDFLKNTESEEFQLNINEENTAFLANADNLSVVFMPTIFD